MEDSQQHKTFEAIIKLYDLAEGLLETTFDKSVADPERHLTVIEPLIEDIEEAADNLIDEYTALVKEGKERDSESRVKLESSLQRIHKAINQCKKAIEENDGN
jgi:hypothetical protein